MKLIETIPYNQTKFKFISSHYDLHLRGLCVYNNTICYFSTIVGNYDEILDEWEESFCQIYKLSFKEKAHWLFKKKKFELMVGYHWTYSYRKTGERPFHYRNPKWLYKWLYRLYFKLK